MNARLTFQLQFFSGVLLALLMGWSLADSHTQNILPSRTPFPEVELFTNVSNVWMVRVKIFKDSEPVIEEVRKLNSGRITQTRGGDSKVSLFDGIGRELYSISFTPQFVISGLDSSISELEMIFILPGRQGQQDIKVITPQGEARYELP